MDSITKVLDKVKLNLKDEDPTNGGETLQGSGFEDDFTAEDDVTDEFTQESNHG